MTDPQQRRTLFVEIVLVSFLVLFQELTLIRWIPSQVRVAAYFPNLVLMSAFLGLGIGCLRSRAATWGWLWPTSLVAVCVSAVAMGRVAFTQESESVHLWLLYFDLENPLVVHDIRLPVLALFVLCTLSFVAPGQYLATRIREATRRDATLRGYAFDLVGSIAGIVAFAALSLLGTSPAVWFGVVVALGTYLFSSGSRRQLAGGAVSGALVVLLVGLGARGVTFSPYYAISTASQSGFSGPVVLTNGSLHQYPAPVASHSNHPGLTDLDLRIRQGYPAPYRMLRRAPGRVLVLGAGSGNDVAVALAAGAEQVDAVEIDPVLAAMGRQIHPNHPYLDPRVTVIHDDARSFLERTDRRYDLVVFGTLDSMTRLSALSTVRLDDFVYTRESLEAARRVMRPDGGLVMYFMVGTPFIGNRLVALHEDVFGRIPATLGENFVMFNFILMSGPAFDHVPRTIGEVHAWDGRDVIRPTDDWPSLYSASRRIPDVYLHMILAIGLFSVLATLASSADMRAEARRGRIDFEMLALGAAFLLLETRAVTQMSLVWGATWITSAVVFASILVMLLFSTLWMDRRPLSPRLSLGGLGVTLAFSYAFDISSILGTSGLARLGITMLVAGAPLFFAASLFAVRFKARSNSDAALGWNLLGAVLGGLLEFTSMVFGIRALALFALGLYVLSAALRAPAPTPAPAQDDPQPA